MEAFHFDQLIPREGTNSVKYDLRNKIFGDADVIPLWVADMDFACPGPVIEALNQRLKHPVLGYTIRNESYFNAIIYWLKIRHNWEVKKEWISFSPGVVSGLAIAIQAFSKPGDEIIIQPPVYTPFYTVVKEQGRNLIFNPLIYNDSTVYMDFEGLKKVITKKTKILLLSNPHNPCSRVWTKEELAILGEICLENNILVFSDEIHSDLIFKPFKHIPFATVSPSFTDISISFLSPSKTFNLAGLSTSYLIIPDDEKLKVYQKMLDTMHLYMGNIFGNIALEAAYTRCTPWLEALLEYLQTNIDIVQGYISENIPQIKPYRTQATYLMWLDCSLMKMNNEELNQFFIGKAGLGLSRGIEYGNGGEGFMRLNLACPREILEKSLQRIKNAL